MWIIWQSKYQNTHLLELQVYLEVVIGWVTVTISLILPQKMFDKYRRICEVLQAKYVHNYLLWIIFLDLHCYFLNFFNKL